MSKKSGLTLIEIIISIALIGILAIVFLPSFTNHFSWIVDTNTKITQETYRAQAKMEENLNRMKEELLLGDIQIDDYNIMGITRRIDEIKLFTSEFKGYSSRTYPNVYQTEVAINGQRKFVSLVGEKRLSELPVPIIEVSSLDFLKDSVPSTTKLEYSNYNNLQIKASSNLIDTPGAILNKYRHDWFVSKPGFNIPFPSEEYIDGNTDYKVYPSYPKDYIALPVLSQISNSIKYDNGKKIIEGVLSNSIIKNYPGRHIVYTITPFAQSLKKGKVSISDPLFISGPKITKNLSIHLDASTVDKESMIIEDDTYYLKTWKNNRPSLENQNSAYNAIQNSKDKRPVFKVENNSEIAVAFQEEDLEEKVWGRSLGNKNINIASMDITDIRSINLIDKWTIFIVMKKVSNPLGPKTNPANSSILSATDNSNNKLWSLDWIGEASNPKLLFSANSPDLHLNSTLNLDEWYLIELTSNGDNSKLKASNLKKENKDLPLEKSGTFNIANTKTKRISINWNGIEISEILIYNADMGSDLEKIEKYLINKYNPE